MYDENYGRVYISECPDCGENEGGYYCQVYKDENHDIEIDNFCIHKEELELIPTTEFWKMAWACGCYCEVHYALRENRFLKMARELNDGLDRYESDIRKCIDWLKEYKYHTNLTFHELNELCWEESEWIFNQIY